MAHSAAAQAMFDDDVASQSLGIELVETGTGTAVARMRITEQMVNGHKIAHGGYLFLLADTAFACACNSHGPVAVAAGAEISFVASARLGDENARLLSELRERTTELTASWEEQTASSEVLKGVSPSGIELTPVLDELVATAEERTRFGRNGIYDVTVRRGAEVIAEFRGRSRSIGKEAP